MTLNTRNVRAAPSDSEGRSSGGWAESSDGDCRRVLLQFHNAVVVVVVVCGGCGGCSGVRRTAIVHERAPPTHAAAVELQPAEAAPVAAEGLVATGAGACVGHGWDTGRTRVEGGVWGG